MRPNEIIFFIQIAAIDHTNDFIKLKTVDLSIPLKNVDITCEYND